MKRLLVDASLLFAFFMLPTPIYATNSLTLCVKQSGVVFAIGSGFHIVQCNKNDKLVTLEYGGSGMDGETGATGATGATGIAGPIGATGIQGVNGYSLLNGAMNPNETANRFSTAGSFGEGTTESDRQIPVVGNLKNLLVRVNSAPGTGNSWTIIVRKNAGDSTISCSISDTNTTCTDSSHTESFILGDLFSVLIHPVSPNVSGSLWWSVQLQ